MPARTIPCWKCGRPFTTVKPNARYCSDPCRPSNTPKASSAKRGYDNRHRAERERLLPSAYGKTCAMCGHAMLRGQLLDFDHERPVSQGGGRASRFLHRACNRSRGNGTKRTPLINRLRTGQAPPRPTTSRIW